VNKIKQLEVKKLLKELDFIESDFDYKNEINYEADNNFIRTINDFLESQPQLKEIFNNKINQKMDFAFQKKIKNIENKELDENIENISEKIVILNPKLEKIKKLYREVVKATHPDRIKNKKLNEIYLRATHFYGLQDLIGMYMVCEELDIFYESDEEDFGSIVEKINKLKERIKFIESTLSWKWYHISDQEERNQIIIDYIKIQLK
jgi:hypothetical protein